MAKESLESGRALEKFKEFVRYQGGDITSIKTSKNTYDVLSRYNGYVRDIDEVMLANECLMMGSGRLNKDDVINHGVGMVIRKHTGDYVKENDVLVTVYYDDKKPSDEKILKSFILSESKEQELPVIYTVIK